MGYEKKYPELQRWHHAIRRANQDRDRFIFSYNGIKFDAIFIIDGSPYKLLIGTIKRNFACILECHPGYRISMDDQDFYALCKILNLSPGKEKFTSIAFLNYIAVNCPDRYSGRPVQPSAMRHYLRDTLTDDEREKDIFLGWNDHVLDKRKAHNFDTTEKYLGKKIADFCRTNNISSLWTSSKEGAVEKESTFPPGMWHGE